MKITQSIVEIADELIAFTVTGTALVCAVHVVWTTGEVPDFLAMGFGVILTFYYTKKVMNKQ